MHASKKNCCVTIVGGGSSAHTIIPLLSGVGHKVNLLTRKPEVWSSNIMLQYQLPSGEIQKTFRGSINKISSEPEEVIAEADVIILCMPVAKYRTALCSIAPFISTDKKVYIGTIYGQGGFNWMVDEIKKEHSIENLVTFAVGLIPWVCRTQEYGKKVVTYGPKAKNVVAVSPRAEYQNLKDLILDDLCFKWFNTGHFYQAENFISLTFSVDNQIIHTSRLYGLYLKDGGVWNKREDVPYFYKDYDQVSADLLEDLDNDYSLIRDAIKELFPQIDFTYMMDYLELERFSYNSENTDIRESFINSQTLGTIQTPIIQRDKGDWVIDKNHRFFTDDIYYGLCIAKWTAQQLSIRVSTIDKILNWAQDVLGRSIIHNDQLVLKSTSSEQFLSGTPDEYNFSTIKDLLD